MCFNEVNTANITTPAPGLQLRTFIFPSFFFRVSNVAIMLRNFGSVWCCPGMRRCSPAASGAAALSLTLRGAASYPVPRSTVAHVKSKRSNFNFLTSHRMFPLRDSDAAMRNKQVYRRVYHTDVAAIKQHREAVRDFISRSVTLLPLDVVTTAFLGYLKRRDGKLWRRTVRKTRSLHGQTKDRLVVHAFFRFLESKQWRVYQEANLSPTERKLLKECRPSWVLDHNFVFASRQHHTGAVKPEKMSPLFAFSLIHRNHPRVPMAWDHYEKLLPVTVRDLVERRDTNNEELKRLTSETPRRRFHPVVRSSVLTAMLKEYVRRRHGGNTKAAVKQLRAEYPAHFNRFLREQRVVAKLMYAFSTTPEAKMFNSGVQNYVQIQRLLLMIANGGMRPSRQQTRQLYRQYKRLPLSQRVSYFGIPPRFTLRPTCGFQLFAKHIALHRQSGGKTSLSIAQQTWRRMSPVQRAAFDFVFPVSIAAVRSSRLPFQKFLYEQTDLLKPPMSRTGRRPQWFYREVMAKWRALPAAEKNRYDDNSEIKAMFPLV